MELEAKYRIANNRERVFGKGPCLLLETVDRLGSLNKAASELNMSYSKAWSIINEAEKNLGFTLLETHTGGADGGGSCLTSKAKDLVKAYKGFCKEADEALGELYKKYFKDI
jgi:molybdate transport system regulatory protein